MSQVHLAIFASGSGSNAENIINYFSDRKEVIISVIISNKTDAYVHRRAERLCVPSLTMSKSELGDSEYILNVLRSYSIDFIVLSGYLLKVPDGLVKAFQNKIVNIHPALLPKFGGKGMYGGNVHKAVILSGEKLSGITIHFVDDHYDEGTTIFQATCPVLENDTPEELASRVHILEYRHFPAVIDETLKKTFPEIMNPGQN